ncbi:hypothetical protein [Saccharopolyspora mangrovi]|uniref:Uncharacterized protein n=1 Tax=Saccharopolyspora mangrovi TaxID=3082379 RepID=A0ABU6A7A8_9PSEU|nr:hypothetical protein [Saccharopolyspora sp. S2-29]MEB3367370.1 hypothetical protein [Saccharopolyspora sp. S2-29]
MPRLISGDSYHYYRRTTHASQPARPDSEEFAKCPACGQRARLLPAGGFTRHRDAPVGKPYAWCYGPEGLTAQ